MPCPKTHKHCFRTRKQARSTGKRYLHNRGMYDGWRWIPDRLTEYRCPHCGYWHLTKCMPGAIRQKEMA